MTFLQRLFGSARASARHVVRVDFDYTLMRLDPALEVHVQSGTRPKSWFFEIEREAEAEDALAEVFVRENARLRRAEPSDPNYFAVVRASHETVPFRPGGPFPWESVEVVWEVSSTFVADGDRLVPLAPSGFTLHLALRGLVEGTVEADDFRAVALPRLQSNRDMVEKILAAPAPFLEMGLEMGEQGSGWTSG